MQKFQHSAAPRFFWRIWCQECLASRTPQQYTAPLAPCLLAVYSVFPDQTLRTGALISADLKSLYSSAPAALYTTRTSSMACSRWVVAAQCSCLPPLRDAPAAEARQRGLSVKALLPLAASSHRYNHVQAPSMLSLDDRRRIWTGLKVWM